MTRRPPRDDPFTLLGLPAGAGLTDGEVRAAWRRVATATHPDRADGGDPERFAAAAAAYTMLRTPFGRGEALADLQPTRAWHGWRRRRRAASRWRPAGGWRALARLGSRVRRGRPARLVLRAGLAAAVGWAAVAAAGSAPATPALITGALTWFVLTARHDLAPPR